MKLINPRKVDFDEVFQRHRNHHSSSLSYNPNLLEYELNLLRNADDFFSFWIKTDISTGTIGKLVLPYHIDKDSKNIVVPEQGEELGDSYERLMVKGREDFILNIPTCFGKIIDQKKLIKEGEVKSFLFSQGPFAKFGRSYNKLSFGDEEIVHLDGFHRLLALMDMSAEDRPNSIESYIAAKENFFEVFK